MLGRGGMGVVHRARQVSTGEKVALKTAPDEPVDPSAGVQLLQEAELTARVRHRNVVRVVGAGRAGGRTYLAMELCPGGTLADRLTSDCLDSASAVRLVAHLAAGLTAVHAHGMVHGDVKPANILLANDGTPKLADFGLAGPAGRSHGPAGTPEYMAPERVRALPAGPAADVWSLGVVLYECLTGTGPFRGGGLLTVLRAVTRANPRSPRELTPSISDEVERICLKCLEMEPSHRYPDASALAVALRRVLVPAPTPS
jgi:eukaryotic-like serine/threonine-protein kinase